MDYIENYKKNISLYQEFVNEIIYTIQEESKSKGLTYANVIGRVKTVESVIEKIERKKIQNPSEDIFDYAGIRIVCLFEEEKEKFAKLVENVFIVTWKENKKTNLGPNQMGYQSLHFCVRFGVNFKGPRYNKFDGLIAEIQITTVLLEAWALINHTLVYKNESAIPLEIQRDINNVSSLLEVAQKVFDDSNKKRDEYLLMIEKSAKNEDILLSQAINFDTLSLFSKTLYPDMNISEFWQNKLIEDLDKNNFKTLRDIFIAISYARPFIEFYKQERPALFKYSTDIITKSLGFFDEDFRNTHDFSPITLEAFKKFKIK